MITDLLQARIDAASRAFAAEIEKDILVGSYVGLVRLGRGKWAIQIQFPTENDVFSDRLSRTFKRKRDALAAMPYVEDAVRSTLKAFRSPIAGLEQAVSGYSAPISLVTT